MHQRSHFESRNAWVAAVDFALTRSDAPPILAATAMDPEVVLTVARVEASCASDRGTSMLSHAELAELTGLPRSAVLRARLALIGLGLEYLSSVPNASEGVLRMLHH